MTNCKKPRRYFRASSSCGVLAPALTRLCSTNSSPRVLLQCLEQQQQEVSKLMELCQQKDGALSRLQAAMDDAVEDATRDVSGLCSWFPGSIPIPTEA